MPFKDTAKIPVMWRGSLVKTATVDNEFAYLLNTRVWHPGSTARPASPRTSVVVNRRTYHLILSRVIFVLSKFKDDERAILWQDVEKLYEYSRRVPDLGFFDLDPFNNTILNLKLKDSPTPITNVSVDFESKMTLPLTALLPSSGVVEIRNSQLSEPVLEALEDIKRAPTTEQILGIDAAFEAQEEESKSVINDMLGILNQGSNTSDTQPGV